VPAEGSAPPDGSVTGARPRVAVVVLSYNGRDLTLSCIESLRASDWPETEIVVVDNHSEDDSVAAIRSEAPEVTLIENASNLGFPAGSNVGIRHALERGCDYVFLLNNDATVAPDCIRRLVEAAEDDGAARILCPLVYYADPPDLIWYAGSEWDPAKIYNGGYHGRGERDVGQFDGVHPTGVATGAAVFVARELFEKIGLLDESLFLQAEDVEYSARATRAGFGVSVVSGAKVRHHVSAASGGEFSPLTSYYCLRNGLHISRRYQKTGPMRRAAFEAGFVAVFLAHARRSDRKLASVRAVLRGWRDYHTGRLGQLHAEAGHRRLPLGLRAWAITRHLPAFKGRTRVAALIARRSIDPRVSYRTPLGIVLRVDPSDLFQVAMLTGFHEPRITRLIAREVPAGSVALDVGHMIGYFSLLMAKRTGPGGEVHAFDPDPRAHRCLVENVSRNSMPWITANLLALGAHAGTAQFGIHERMGWSSTKEVKAFRDWTSVPMQTLDSYVAEHEIDPARISVIKVDAEGGELEVLEGARDTLAAGAPHVVVEVIPHRPGERADEILKYMEGLGYKADAPAGDLAGEVVFTRAREVTQEARRAGAPAASR
jgi:FkbM family methyltransferase